MQRYNPSEIEPKWQEAWQRDDRYRADESTDTQKAYVTAMFPYPSGAGLHVGHVRNYSITDAIARFHRQRGFNVLSTIGWDAFGLPAENYAIKTGVSPQESTATNIANFKNQLQKLGMSYDWSREINTTDPAYYKWTQWIFTELFKHDLAYQAESLQWWCPECKTVLANEQVINGGYCWRHEDTPVIKKYLKQWFLRITAYADQLLEGTDALEWPEKIKAMQKNWIGRSKGAEITFEVEDGERITVFTTRPDTLFGATFLVLAPEHPLTLQLAQKTPEFERVEAYVMAAQKKSDIERMNTDREKTGVFTGTYAINPATNEKVPVWTADYVLTGYGTGAIMAVPAHDERDHEFATVHDLPITPVYEAAGDGEPFGGEGILKNSGQFDGMRTEEARDEITAVYGEEKVNYRMRDWLVSRQRYWGAPIPIIHCPNHGAVAVPEDWLPVELPKVESYQPTGDGLNVLASVEEWVNTTCPECGGPAKRETDTMDGYACSSWYFLRYTDARNIEKAWDKTKADYWLPIDYYCGGDHAVSHLLYSRFWMHFFADRGLISADVKEPVKRLVYNGYINAADGAKMSKSKGNVVDPLELIDQGYGADALRVYELFIAPYELDAAWDPRGIAGTYRFLNRAWTLTQEFLAFEGAETGDTEALLRAQHKTVKKVTDDLHRLSFNTAIAALMEYVNDLYKLKVAGMAGEEWKKSLMVLVQMVAPFAPHIADELWQQLGASGSVHVGGWPEWDESYLQHDKIKIAVQVNGKLRAEVEVASDATEDEVKAAALQHEKVAASIGQKEPTRVIYVPGRLVNVVLK